MPRQPYLMLPLSIALLAGCAEQPTEPAVGDGPLMSAGASEGCAYRANVTAALLLECVTLEGVREHQAALQAIADANNGTRGSGSPGYDQSVEYVVGKLEAAGYQLTVQPFQFQAFIYLSAPVLEQVSPPPAGPIANTIMSYSRKRRRHGRRHRPAGPPGGSHAWL